jgi:cytochrome c
MRSFIGWGLLPGLVAAAAVSVATAQAASPPYMWVNPPSKAFGDLAVGSSVSQTFTLTNIGGRQTGILQTSLAGPNADQYKLVSDGCTGRRLRPGDNCSVTVAFAPSVLGTLYAQVNVTADNPPGGVFPQLSGTGIPAV